MISVILRPHPAGRPVRERVSPAPPVPGSATVADHPPPGLPPAPPAPADAWPPLAPAVTPPPGPLGRVATVLAGLALLAYVVASLLLVVPVETPEVQDCGAPGAYLLAGRLDRIPDDEGRILGPDGDVVTLDADVAAVARATPCRERVAARGVPAAILVAAATVLGVIAFALELFVVRPRQRRQLRAAAMGPPPLVGDDPGGSGG